MSSRDQEDGFVAMRDAFADRLAKSCLAMFDIVTIYIGEQLGLYRALADGGSSTSAELSIRTGTAERYVREWLEQQTVNGILHVANPKAGAVERKYSLPEAHARVLLGADDPLFMGPYAQQMIGTIHPLQSVISAFRDGGGVPYESYGADCRDGIAAGNRVAFVNLIGSKWFPAMPGLDARLRSDPPARVLDVGCGYGWAAISIARAYPRVHVDALDLDAASIEVARRNAAENQVGDRVHFQVSDAAEAAFNNGYDLVTAFETLHDMARPVQALQSMRRLVAAGGTVLVVDERVNDVFTTEAGDIERLYYGFSVLHCLPAGMATQPSAATGTVMRSSTLREYARQAGFRDVEVMPVDYDFWRFYRLIP